MRPLALSITAMAFLLTLHCSKVETEDEKFESFANSYIEKLLEMSPELATSLGDHRFDHRIRTKLRYTLESDLSLEEILRQAQEDLHTTQEVMFETALPMYKRYFPQSSAAISSIDRKKVVKAVLDKLAEMRPTNDSIVGLAKESLQNVTEFVRKQELVTVPQEPVKIIVMPEFQRGVAVAYCDSPGPLEKNGETFFSISPTPSDWSAQRVQSFFREYNNHMLQDLTIHEAMPGHYLQLALSNRFKAPTLIRAIFSSGPFVEGWATYAEQLMVEKGFGGPEVKMQQLKMRLRLIINAILDQKIHTARMTEKEAMDLMTNEGFQETRDKILSDSSRKGTSLFANGRRFDQMFNPGRCSMSTHRRSLTAATMSDHQEYSSRE